MSDDEIYERFLEIMFEEYSADEMAYAHHAQQDIIDRERNE